MSALTFDHEVTVDDRVDDLEFSRNFNIAAFAFLIAGLGMKWFYFVGNRTQREAVALVLLAFFGGAALLFAVCVALCHKWEKSKALTTANWIGMVASAITTIFYLVYIITSAR